MLFYMNQQHIAPDYCTKYEYNQPILCAITTNTQNVWRSGHNYSNLVQSHMLFYKHEQHIVPDYCTKHEQHHHIRLWDITTNTQNLWKSCHNYSNVNRAKFYFMCTSSQWYPMMVQNMKEIHPAIMDECVRIDRWIDRWIGPIPVFPNPTIVEWGIISILFRYDFKID